MYLAIQDNFQRKVALKVMAPALAQDDNFSERFLREARIVSNLVHPNIVTVHDVGIKNGHHYLSMEYIEGDALNKRLPELSGEQLIRIVKEIAKALDYAGGRGYVHRDVKPDNIMLHEQDGRAILMDFGIARAAECTTNMTRTGTALGTPHYMSPEQARGQAIDHRSDLYSLGVLFYYLMTGEVPFDGDSAIAIGIKHVSAPLPKLPGALHCYQGVIDKLLAKTPTKRYQSGRELVTVISAIDSKPINRWQQQRQQGKATVVNQRQPTPPHEPIPVESLSASNPKLPKSESLTIPREDLAERQRQTSRGIGAKVALLAVTVLLIGGGWLIYNDPAISQKMSQKIRAWQQQSLADELPRETTPAEVPSATTPEVPAISNAEQLRQHLAQADTLSQQLDQQPDRLTELVPQLLQHYRDALALQAYNRQANRGIAALQQQALAAAEGALAEKDLTTASQLLVNIPAWFPESTNPARLQKLQQQLEETLTRAEQIDRLLTQAQTQFANDRLLQPKGDNALGSYRAVLAIEANNPDALAGLGNIVRRYNELAVAAKNQGRVEKALTYINKGLQIDDNNLPLKNLQRQLIGQQQTDLQIQLLIDTALELEQQQQWFSRSAGEPSAAQSYLSILTIDASHPQAKAGLERLVQRVQQSVEQAIAAGDYQRASAALAGALQTLPNDRLLVDLQNRSEAIKPALQQLVISGSEIDDTTLATNRFSADRTLHIAFSYRNLAAATTVVQAILLDGSRQVQIAAVPVVVSGRDGSTRFRIDRPVEGFAPGGYHLDLLLAENVILSQAFTIAK